MPARLAPWGLAHGSIGAAQGRRATVVALKAPVSKVSNRLYLLRESRI